MVHNEKKTRCLFHTVVRIWSLNDFGIVTLILGVTRDTIVLEA